MNPAVPPSSTPPPVVVQQKQGPGCWGIGCAIVLICLLLLGGLSAGISWYFKKTVGSFVTSAPTTVQSFDGGDAMYHATLQKFADFGKAMQENQPATLELSADELNTVFARDPDIQANHIRAYITMTGSQAHLETSLPGNLIPISFLKDSFINLSADLSPTFDSANKTIVLNLKTLNIGNQQVPAAQLPTMEQQFEPMISMQMQQSPNSANFLNHLQSLEVKDGKLVVTAQ